MNYTLHQLKILVTIYESGGITKAAQNLFLTQPAVSIQLKNLQQQFDIPLTENIGRKLYFTDFGKEIVNASKRILKEATTIESTMLQYKGLLAGKIKISVVSTGKYVLPYFMGEFVQEHPEVEISIDVTNKAKVIESLVQNETDFALVSVLPEDINVEKMELMENTLYLVGSPERIQQDEKTIKKKSIENLPMIFREHGSATRNAMEEFLKSKKITPRVRREMVSNEAVKQAVCAGLGYSIMPITGMKQELESDKLRIISISGLPIKTSWNLIYNKEKKLTPASLAFLEHVGNNIDSTIEKHFSYLKGAGDKKS